MEENKTVRLKGIAYPKHIYVWKQRHPHRWKLRQFIKRIFKPLGIHVKFQYPDE